MKKTMMMIAVMMVLGGFSRATEPFEYNTCMEYMTTNIPNAKAPFAFALQANDDGLSIIWNIKTMPKPTFAQLDAIKPQALAWKKNKDADEAADVERMEKQVKLWIKTIVKVHNDKCPAGEKFTMAEIKDQVKILAQE